MPPRGQPAGQDRLDSWKEIAAYLGRVERTVRRWESEEGLPVHRHQHARQGSVYAFKSELDAWRASRSTVAAEPPDEDVREEESSPAEPPRNGRRLAIAGGIALLLAGAGVAAWALRPQAPASQIRSIAVLPFENLSRDPGQEFFSDGTTDALISGLAQVHALRVISRTTMMRYKGTSKKLPEIGRELGVDAVVEGAVQRSGSRVRVSARLIRASNDADLWAHDYEEELADALKLESSIAQAIAGEIRVHVTPEEQRLLASNARVNPQAQDEYLLGRYLHAKATPSDMLPAVEHLKKAIGLQPDYAAAYAELSTTYQDLDDPQHWPEMVAVALKARDLDPNLSEAHSALAGARLLEKDWTTAEVEYKRAIELNPNSLDACGCYAMFLADLGRFSEASTNVERAVTVNPMSGVAHMIQGFVLMLQRKYQDAAGSFERGIELEPESYYLRATAAVNYILLGRKEQAVSLLDRPEFHPSGHLALALAAAGRSQDAGRMLETLAKSSRRDAYFMAGAYLQLGDRERGVAWLSKAFAAKENYILAAKVDPLWDSVRNDPRVQKLIAQLRIPEKH